MNLYCNCLCNGMATYILIDTVKFIYIGGNMGFLEAYKSFWRNYVNFSGRAPRSAYWYVVLWNVIIFVILYALAFILVFQLLWALWVVQEWLAVAVQSFW